MSTTDEKDVAVDFKGWRFRSPFRCLCCGKRISLRQFCFGRACAPCDMGTCKHTRSGNLYSGPRELIDKTERFFLAENRWLNPVEGLAFHPDDGSFDETEAMIKRVLEATRNESTPLPPASGL